MHQLADATRCDDRRLHCALQSSRRFGRRADARPVALDVGVEDRGGAPAVDLRGELGRQSAAVLEPALHRHSSTARVDGDDDPVGTLGAERSDQLGILDGGGAEDHPLRARAPPALGRLSVAHAAAHLHAQPGAREDRRDDLGVDRTPLAGPVQIDDMQTLRALRFELRRHGRGIGAVDGDGVVVPAMKAHDVAV